MPLGFGQQPKSTWVGGGSVVVVVCVCVKGIKKPRTSRFRKRPYYYFDYFILVEEGELECNPHMGTL